MLVNLTGCNNKEVQQEETIDYSTYRIKNINNVVTGDHMLFGMYEQDNNINTNDEIEWLVVSRNEEQVTLLSYSGLDALKSSNIEDWLKSKLISDFTDEDKRYVDEIRMLNLSELNELINEEDKLCSPTKYAISNGAAKENNTNTCCWLIKDKDILENYVEVQEDGNIEFINELEPDYNYILRPVLVLNTSPSQEEKQEVKQENPVIEVLDTQMNVYSTVDKKSTKNGVVYKGDRFECLTYYETPGYKWYQIGTNQWLGDGNDTRIKLVKGNLIQTTTEPAKNATSEETKEDKDTKLKNKIYNISDIKFENSYIYSKQFNIWANDHLIEYFDGNLETMPTAQFNSTIKYKPTKRNVGITIDHETKIVKISLHVYGDIETNQIVKETIKNVEIRDDAGHNYYFENPDEELKDILLEVTAYYFEPGGEYPKVADEAIKKMIAVVREIYPEYAIESRWFD